MANIFGFYGGVHPPTLKLSTSDKSARKVFIPNKVIIPLLQHVGSPAEPVVTVGDSVNVGQIIGRPSGFISSAIHSTISGKVTGISYSPTPTLPRALSVSIESDGKDQEFKVTGQRKLESFSREDLLGMIKEAGVVGLGGASFPTHVKLSPPENKPITSVILNGAECEPYLTCDHRLMVERPKEILKGLEIIIKILGAKDAYIAIEDNKSSAIYAMEKELSAVKSKTAQYNVRVAALKTKYPQGAEKQLIKSILNRVVPAGGLPMDVGCIVQNVGTTFAIYEAVYLKKPLLERVITISGSCIKNPTNLNVRVGTLLSELVDSIGGFIKEPKKIIFGGPMMGIAQYTMDIPITKGTIGVLFLSKDEIDEPEEGVCIRCGKCIEVCPMGLSPTTLMNNVKKERFLEAKELGITNCFECGACAYECPAKIRLLDYMKLGKANQ